MKVLLIVLIRRTFFLLIHLELISLIYVFFKSIWNSIINVVISCFNSLLLLIENMIRATFTLSNLFFSGLCILLFYFCSFISVITDCDTCGCGMWAILQVVNLS